MIDFTDASSASCPVTTGYGCAPVPYPLLLSADRIPIDRPSYGDSTPSTFAPDLYVDVSRFSIRFCAVAGSHRRIATVLKSFCPDFTTSVPSLIYGSSTLIAPLKKNVALLSSGEPANNSTLNGPFAEPFDPSAFTTF